MHLSLLVQGSQEASRNGASKQFLRLFGTSEVWLFNDGIASALADRMKCRLSASSRPESMRGHSHIRNGSYAA
jgi:hypothetical protein